MRPTRTALMLLLLLAALPAAAAPQPRTGAAPLAPAPGDPLPLRPASVGMLLEDHGHAGVRAGFVRPGGPAARAGVQPGYRVLSVDGTPAVAGAVQRSVLALAGPAGGPVEVEVEFPDGVRKVTLVREDVLAPGPGYGEVVVMPHFVVHHRPGEERRRRAVREGRRAERAFARHWGGVESEGRRAHLYLREPGEVASTRIPFYVRWVPGEPYFPRGDEAYVALGPGGPAAHVLGAVALPRAAQGWHRMAASNLLAIEPWEFRGPDSLRLGGMHAQSLGAYVIERFGIDRYRALRRAESPVGESFPRVLGLSYGQLLDDWRRYVLTLGPRPDAGPGRAGAAVTLGWGAVVLLAGVWVARRKEVG